MDLQGTTVVVTGGSRGIGRGIVEAFAAEGSNIVIGDVSSVDPSDAIKAAEALGVKAISVPTDVRDEQQCQALVKAALDRFKRLDVMCANAGVISLAPIAELSESEWDRVMDVNAKGVFLTCKAAIPHFTEQRNGAFVITASIAGKKGSRGAAHYGASKFAAIGFMQALALEMGPFNVRANAVCPGYLATSMWLNDILGRQRESGRDTKEIFDRVRERDQPLAVETTPADIGQAAVYLARADSVTGVSLNIASGLEMN
jgi:meso-butanediol dehydrogenase/(S,S)-butanediol dehydrogenase/diacetyl reductase